MNWKERSTQLELLDDDNIPFADIRRNMDEINTINTWLGGHQITLKGLQKMLPANRPVHIAEIGCGDGNNLQVIQNWCAKKNIDATLTGIDIKDTCIAAAKEKKWNNATFIINDYKALKFEQQPDIIFSSLFCHHFSSEALAGQLRWMHDQASVGFFINDLHRHPLAYYSIKWITALFSNSYLVKHDAPLSVARGFSKKDWQEIIQKAGLSQAEVEWKWAFRFLISLKKNG